ncbi:MAG: hypothetical protein WAT46_03055 [Saprospiraceae bacterium]
MAKSPDKNPPMAQMEAGEESVPSMSLDISDISTTKIGLEAVPVFDPPSTISGDNDDSFGAGVWHNNKKVSGLFSTNETRNSHMNIVGTGWVKLANNIDSATEALNVLATSAKVKNSPINYLLDGGMATQIYVW